MSSIQDMISEAWSLFDNKRYDDSRAVYNECYSMLDKDDDSFESCCNPETAFEKIEWYHLIAQKQ